MSIDDDLPESIKAICDDIWKILRQDLKLVCLKINALPSGNDILLRDDKVK